MATQTNVNPETEVKTETEVEQSPEVKSVLADATIVADKTIIKLMTSVDNVQVKVGGKWVELIEYCQTQHYSQGDDAELKIGRKVVLKTLLEMGKTESSAYSIRSFIFKMSKPEMAEDLAKMKQGEISVREARKSGSKRQTSPSLSNEERYRRALNDTARWAVELGYSSAKVGDDAASAFNEYQAKQTQEKNDKEEAKKALAETAKQIKEANEKAIAEARKS